MKNILSVSLIILLACNNEVSTNIGSENDSAGIENKKAAYVSGDNCGNTLWFRKGAQVHTSSYDAQGIEIAKQVSTVINVSTQGSLVISELEMKSTDQHGANEKIVNASYKCDGKLFYVDLASFLSMGNQDIKIETSGLPFPLAVTVGDTLPDVDYSMVMNSGGNARKINSHILARKVDSKERVTTKAGTFECYKISSLIETEIDMPGINEKQKKAMEEMKKKMGKNKMTFWYAPDVTIIKMELHMGDKLMTRSEVTAIKK